jgi:hypothetical protein
MGCQNEAGATGDDANVTAGTCEVFSAFAQRNLSKDELANLKDPIAQKLLLGEGCPTNLNEITAKLANTDSKGCEKNEGVATRLVNDSVFLTGAPGGSYRGVMTRDCSGRTLGSNTFFLSMFGITPTAPELPPEQTELIGLDDTADRFVAGVFNYYVRESRENRWVFMGSSKDAVSHGYTCDAFGACEPNAAKTARCFACHEGGGLNMKELHNPWDSWSREHSIDAAGNQKRPSAMPGADDIFKRFGKQLGRVETGPDLEDRVESGNDVWNQTRIEVLKAMGAAELLRPLFCTLTMNLEGQLGGMPRGVVKFLDKEFFVGSEFGAGAPVQVDDNDYQALLKQNGQVVMTPDVGGGTRPLVGKNGTIIDTETPLRYPAKGKIDMDYIFSLIDRKIIDEDFKMDVLHVDFTRPVFSKTRCDLLSAAPDLKGADLTPDKLREGFKANLKNATGPGAAQLLANLSLLNDQDAHRKDTDAFLAACRARPKKDLLADTLVYASHLRNALRAHRATEGAGKGQGIIEFPETLPVDQLPDSDKAFDPVSCTLK